MRCLPVSRLILGVLSATVVAVLPSPARPAGAAEPSVEQRLMAVEAEMARLRGGVEPAAWMARAGCGTETCGTETCGMGTCGNTGCCDGSSGRCTGGLYGGAALIYVKPHFKEAFQISAINAGTGQQTLIPFAYDYGATPEMWLGYELPGGLGIRGRYWQFDHSGDGITRVSDGQTIYSANATTVIFPATIVAANAGDVLTSNDRLQTEIVDAEATVRTNIGRIEVIGGAGLRYASLTQSLSSVVVNSSSVTTGVLQWTRDFDGVGPVISLRLQRPLGNCGVSAFAKGSGSLLFGQKSLNRTVIGDAGTPPASPFLSLSDADEVVGIGEAALGVEWRREIGGGELALSGEYQGQLWAEAGAPTLGFLGFEGFGFAVEWHRVARAVATPLWIACRRFRGLTNSTPLAMLVVLLRPA